MTGVQTCALPISMHTPCPLKVDRFNFPSKISVSGSQVQESSSFSPFSCDFATQNLSGFTGHSTNPSLNPSTDLWVANPEMNPSCLSFPQGNLFLNSSSSVIDFFFFFSEAKGFPEGSFLHALYEPLDPSLEPPNNSTHLVEHPTVEPVSNSSNLLVPLPSAGLLLALQESTLLSTLATSLLTLARSIKSVNQSQKNYLTLNLCHEAGRERGKKALPGHRKKRN